MLLKSKTSLLFLASLLIVLLFSVSVHSESVELEMWTFMELHADYYENQAEEFDEANPDIDFSLNAITYPYNEMHDQLRMSLQTGIEVPDLVDVEITQFYSTLTVLDEPAFVDLTELVDEYRDVLIEDRLAPYSLNGNVYGIPSHLGASLVFYNVEIFEKAGIDIDEIETWEDYIEVGKEITQDTNDDGEIDQYMTAVETSNKILFHSLTRQYGGNSVFDENLDIMIDREENIKVMQMLQDFVYEHEIAELAPGGEYADPNFYDAFSNGKYASFVNGSWYIPRFPEFMPELEGKIEVRVLPAFKDGDTRMTTNGGTGTAITNHSDHPEVAKEFLEFSKLTEEANIAAWTDRNYDPIREDVYDASEINEPHPYFNDQNIIGAIAEAKDELLPLRFGEEVFEADDLIMSTIMHRVLRENEDPAEVLSEAAEKLRN